MFTVKLAWSDWERQADTVGFGSYQSYTAWLADIAEVRKFLTLTVWDYDSIHYTDILKMYEYEIEYYCPASREKPGEWQGDNPTVTLLGLTTPGRQFLVLTSQAWLLGPNGDTIERIAP